MALPVASGQTCLGDQGSSWAQSSWQLLDCPQTGEGWGGWCSHPGSTDKSLNTTEDKIIICQFLWYFYVFFLLYFSFRPHSTTQPRSDSGCQKLKHRSPNFSLLCQFLQLFRGNTEAFLGQPRDYEPPPGLLLQNNILVVDLCLCKKIVVSFYVMLLCKKNPKTLNMCDFIVFETSKVIRHGLWFVTLTKEQLGLFKFHQTCSAGSIPFLTLVSPH